MWVAWGPSNDELAKSLLMEILEFPQGYVVTMQVKALPI